MLAQPASQEIKPSVIKHDWYQTESHVCVTVLVKNLDPNYVTVEFSESTVSYSTILYWKSSIVIVIF